MLFRSASKPQTAPQASSSAQPGAPSAAPLTPAAPANPQELIGQAKSHYDAATQATRDGDWTKYGEEIKELGEILQQLIQSSGQQKSGPKP